MTTNERTQPEPESHQVYKRGFFKGWWYGMAFLAGFVAQLDEEEVRTFLAGPRDAKGGYVHLSGFKTAEDWQETTDFPQFYTDLNDCEKMAEICNEMADSYANRDK